MRAPEPDGDLPRRLAALFEQQAGEDGAPPATSRTPPAATHDAGPTGDDAVIVALHEQLDQLRDQLEVAFRELDEQFAAIAKRDRLLLPSVAALTAQVDAAQAQLRELATAVAERQAPPPVSAPAVDLTEISELIEKQIEQLGHLVAATQSGLRGDIAELRAHVELLEKRIL